MIDWVQRVAQKCAVVNEIKKKKKKRGPVLLLTFGWLRSHQCTRSRSLKFVIQLLNRVSVLLNTISIIHNLFILNPIICQEHWPQFLPYWNQFFTYFRFTLKTPLPCYSHVLQIYALFKSFSFQRSARKREPKEVQERGGLWQCFVRKYTGPKAGSTLLKRGNFHTLLQPLYIS